MKNVSFTIDVDCGIGDKKLQNREIINVNAALVSQAFEKAVPRFLEFLDSMDAKGTFFIVSKTVKTKTSENLLREIVELGHEVGSHTSCHDKNFGKGTYDNVLAELSDSKLSLENFTGKEVIGFRAPGYYINNKMYDCLIEAGYRYSSSVNSSLMYNSVKYAASLIGMMSNSDDVDYPISLSSLLKSNSIGFYGKDGVNFSSKTKQEKLVEIPITCDGLHFAPSVIFFHDMIMPKFMTRSYIHHVSKLNFSNFVFHDFEFLEQSDVPNQSMPFATKSSIDKRLKRKALVKVMREKYSNHNKSTLSEQYWNFVND
jgi:peptidoglycan/xylan/chitin deacetylase (PgdA/CDA1 family)